MHSPFRDTLLPRDPAVTGAAALAALGGLLAGAGDGGAWLQLVIAGAAFVAAYARRWNQHAVAAGAAVGYLTVEMASGRLSFDYYWKDALALALLAAATYSARALRLRTLAARAAADAARSELDELLREDEVELLLAGGRPPTAVERELFRAARNAHTSAVALLRPDGIVNLAEQDSASADALLRAVAESVSARLRTSDVGYRRGPFDIGVLLPETDLAGARVGVERLRLAVAGGGVGTVSAGVAVYPSAGSAEELETHAEIALAEAARQGGNRTVLSEPTPDGPPGWSLPSRPKT